MKLTSDLRDPVVEEVRAVRLRREANRRVGSATTAMSQEEYARLVFDRSHSCHRWEHQSAVGVRTEDLDHEEILRTRAAAIEKRRISAGTSTDVGDILDRLGLRRNGVITQAAQILYGTRWLPDHPQGMLKLGRFRGTKITGDIVDSKQENMRAFAIVREAIAWLDRTLPLAARFPSEKIGSSGESVGARLFRIASAPVSSTRCARPPLRFGPSGDEPSASARALSRPEPDGSGAFQAAGAGAYGQAGASCGQA